MNKSKPLILVVDDEPDIRQLLSITLSRMGMNPHAVENIAQAYRALEEQEFQLCLSDLRLPDGSGLDLVTHLQTNQAQLPVIVITAHGSMDIAIKAMKLGAFDFINKPINLNNLRSLIFNALSSRLPTDTHTIHDIIGECDTTQALKDKIIKVSRSQAPVFISGESGSGKELVAKAIHNISSRKDKPFIAVNCGAIPKELMESEFFGHTKGSFTGAHQDKKGLFQTADGGTLLLDEIADLPLDMQVKLLRVIQEKTVRPIGGQQEVAFDVRIISATHKNLLDAVSHGEFRSDLFYRVNVIDIQVPPLRERKEDIVVLSQYLLEKISIRNNVEQYRLTSEAIAALQLHHFPGNIRELDNILERACALSENHRIDKTNLIFSGEAIPIEKNTHNIKSSVEDNHHSNYTPEKHPLVIDYDTQQESIDDYLAEIEKAIILEHLNKHRWNRTATAKALGMTFRSLRYRLKKLGVDIDNQS